MAANWLYRLADFFSVDILLKTWFQPWKNDVIAAQNIALSDQVKIWQQNLISRLVGFFLRTVVILLAAGLLVMAAGLLLIGLAVWIATPLLVFLLPFTGLILLLS